MAPVKKERTRKRKLEVEPQDSERTTAKRQTRSSTAAAVVLEATNLESRTWTMFKGYDKKEKRILLKNERTSVCSEEVQVSLPPKLMDPSEVPSTGKVNSYSRTNYLQTITEVLNGTEHFDILKKSSLFNVFKIPVKRGALSGRLLHYMLGRMVLTRKKYEIWFVFGNKPIKYSLREFALVTGLNCGPYPEMEKSWSAFTKQATSEEAYWWELLGPLGLEDGSITEICTFLTDDKKKPARKQISNEQRFKLCLILLVDGVLCPKNSAAVKVSPTTVELTRDIDEFLNFPWGRLSFELSLEMVRVGSSSNPSIQKFVQRYHQTHLPMKGLSIAFQLVFYKAIPAITAHLSKPVKDTNFADPKLKAEDLKDCRDIRNKTLNDLENDPMTDVYSIVAHGGYSLVSTDFSWDDEVDDISVQLLENLLRDAYVFNSTEWVKGTIDLPKCKARLICQGERLPTKKGGKKAGDEATPVCESDDDEDVGYYDGDLGLLKGLWEEGCSKIHKYVKFIQKDVWKKFCSQRKKDCVGSEDFEVNKKSKSMHITELHDSDTDSFDRLMRGKQKDIGQTSKVEEVEESHNASTAEEEVLKGVKNLEEPGLENRVENIEEVVMESNVEDHVVNSGEKMEDVDFNAGVRNVIDSVDRLGDIDVLKTNKEKGEEGDDGNNDVNRCEKQQDELRDGEAVPVASSEKVVIGLECPRDTAFVSEKISTITKESDRQHVVNTEKQSVVDSGLQPLPEELETAFQEIYSPEHSTGDVAMTLMIDMLWDKLRPKLESNRVVIYPPFLCSLLMTEFKRYADFCKSEEKKPTKSQFFWSQTLGNVVAGTCSSRAGANEWFVDIDRIYAPMNWMDKKHWVAVCIDLVSWNVTVFDCFKDLSKEEEVMTFMQPILEIVPLLIQQFASGQSYRVTNITRLTYNRPDVAQDVETGNCGPFTVKYIEMYSQGHQMGVISKEMVRKFRMKYAFDVYEHYVGGRK